MSRYLTRGMVVIADDQPGTKAALFTAREYTPRAVVVAAPDVPDVPEADMVRPRQGVSIDAAFRCAADEQIPWIAMRRDYAEPRLALSQVLEATGRRTSKDLPGFVVVFTGSQPRPIRRILAIVDKADGQPSGLLVLAAVAAAQATGADLDVLLMGAAGEAVSTPTDVRDAIHVTRDKDLYEQGIRRAKETGIRANWIAAEEVADKRSLVLEQIAEGDYDLVVEDLGSVSLGGRLGRGGRIARAVGPDGPAQIVRAILEETDVPMALVLDGVRLGLVPPAVVKGGAGAVLALGIIASGAPAATASPSELARQQTTVSQNAEAYGAALHEAAALASPAAVQAALASTTDATATEEAAVDSAAAEDADAEAVVEEVAVDAADDESAEDAAADAEAAPEVSDVAPAELAPEDVVPESAPEVDADEVDLDSDDVTSDDVAKAEKAAEKAADELKAAEDAFDEAQEAAVEATEEVALAAEAAADAAAEGDAAVQAYAQVTAAATEVVADATGMTGALPGGATQEDLAAAEAAQAEALADVEAAGESADDALLAYEEAAAEAAATEAELTDAAAEVTAADATYQEDAAVADATADAYKEAVANSRVTPVPGYEITTAFGVPGSHWSTGYHTGVDYASPEGTEVVAAASGTVVYAQNDGGSYGNRIVIKHENGYSTTYNHLSDIDVEVGQEVTAGDAIGEVGNTGNSFGAHLHFEVTQGGDGWGSGHFEDPADWLEGEIG